MTLRTELKKLAADWRDHHNSCASVKWLTTAEQLESILARHPEESHEDRFRRLESEKSPLPNPPGPVKV